MERRRHPRAPVDLEVRFGRGESGRARNLGAGGLLLVAARAPALGETFDLQVPALGDFTARARAVFVGPDATDGSKHRIGCAFVELLPENRRIIQKTLSRAGRSVKSAAESSG